MNSTAWIVTATLLVGALTVVVWGIGGVYAPLQLNSGPFNTPSTTPEVQTTEPATTTIKLALLDTAGITRGKERGCDRVVMAEREILETSSVLNAAMRELFAEERQEVAGAFNFIARTNNTLRFDHAIIEDGTAKIYLTGNLSGLAGVCDDPRAQIQIEETALQFATVQKVEIYLNGTKTNLTPSQQ